MIDRSKIFSKKSPLMSALLVTITSSSLGLFNSNYITAIAIENPPSKPNLILQVDRQAGICPKTVGIWSFLLPYEGGAEHTAVANTLLLASQPPKIVSKGDKFVEFQAPLRPNYVSCVGKATWSSPNVYNFQFAKGRISFRVDITKLNAPYSKITAQEIVAFRPYVRWSIAD